jgi:hypothetical protein
VGIRGKGRAISVLFRLGQIALAEFIADHARIELGILLAELASGEKGLGESMIASGQTRITNGKAREQVLKFTVVWLVGEIGEVAETAVGSAKNFHKSRSCLDIRVTRL